MPPPLRWLLSKSRPTVSAEVLLLGLSVYFTLVCNSPLLQALLAGRPWGGATLAYVLALAVALTALHFLVFAPFLTRWTSKPLLAAAVLVSASASYFAGQYGVHFDPGMLHTDAAEAGELLTAGLFLHLAAYSFLPLAALWRVNLSRPPVARAVLRRVAAMGLALLLGAAAAGSVFKEMSSQFRKHKEIRYLVTPAAPLWSLARVLVSDAHGAPRFRQPVGTDARLGGSWKSTGKPVLLVFVLGETARAANWGTYRPPGSAADRDTHPELSARGDLIQFAEVDSCGTSTEVSLPCMFSSQGRRHYDEEAIQGSENLLDTLKHAGLRVAWEDNQSGCKGVCAGVERLRPDSAAQPELCPAGRCLDEALIASSRQWLRGNPGSAVLVLHQLGSHGPAYYRRYPAAFRRFTPACENDDLSLCSREEIANSYDNSLLYTDHVLASTIAMLEDLESTYDTALIYVSDHGESLGENGLYLHGVPYAMAPREQTRVPMLLWLSPDFAARSRLDIGCLRTRAAQAASHDNLFHTVLGLLDIGTTARDAALDLSHACRT